MARDSSLQNNLGKKKKKNKVGRLILFVFKIYYKVTVIKTVCDTDLRGHLKTNRK